MILPLLLFALTCAVSPSDGPEVKLQRGNCPMFWFSFNNRCYKYVSTQMTWAATELYCVKEGANLVSIHSLDEDNFVRSLIRNFDHAEGRTWIGLSDLHEEDSWMWSDGSAVDFTFWSSGQPDNSQGGEHCGHNNHINDKKWNDYNCSDNYPSVCASLIMCSQ
ncbi:lactose-binding lectin l-2-like [Limanda limanda]|uniref:lactose-binding lectin l-2-like n=1 Tax=Limanda limanda TaxID=27771 RepID=UPI0029C826D6|nr:lactose-binding lectin l-2-like [Limanda limanda]